MAKHMFPVLTSPRGRIFGGGAEPVGPELMRLRSSGRAGDVEEEPEALEPEEGGRPDAGMEKPTTEDVGRRDLEDEAVESAGC